MTLRKDKLVIPAMIVIMMTSMALIGRCYEKKVQGLQETNRQQELQITALRASEAKGLQQISKLTKELSDSQSLIKSLEVNSGWSLTDGIATAYSPHDNKSGIECGADPNATSIGLQPGSNVIAVDPKKIPYHSEVLVIYADGTMSRGIAGDTGQALTRGGTVHVDIYKDTYAETQQFGKRKAIILWRPSK